jgi:hypothetical protein
MPLPLTHKSSETARNSKRVLMTWICSIPIAESTTVGHGISLKGFPIARHRAAVRIIVLTTKATWDN